MGLQIWLNAVNNRMSELTKLLESVENTQEKLMALDQSRSTAALESVQMFALAEVVFSFVSLAIVFLLPDTAYIKQLLSSWGAFAPEIVLLFLILLPLIVVYMFYYLLNWYSSRKMKKFKQNFLLKIRGENA